MFTTDFALTIDKIEAAVLLISTKLCRINYNSCNSHSMYVQVAKQ